MSKSTGNVIDPLEMINSTDLRFTLTSFAAMGRDIKLEERIEGYRHFTNKVWNAALCSYELARRSTKLVTMMCHSTTSGFYIALKN